MAPVPGPCVRVAHGLCGPSYRVVLRACGHCGLVVAGRDLCPAHPFRDRMYPLLPTVSAPHGSLWAQHGLFWLKLAFIWKRIVQAMFSCLLGIWVSPVDSLIFSRVCPVLSELQGILCVRAVRAAHWAGGCPPGWEPRCDALQWPVPAAVARGSLSSLISSITDDSDITFTFL